MSNRTLKALCIIAASISLLLAFTGCGQPVVYTQPMVQPVQQVQQPQYEIIQDPNSGIQYSVFYDNGIQQMVELSLFNSWYNRPNGWSYVIHHYHDNPSYYRRYDNRAYGSYNRVPRSSSAYSPNFRSSTTPSVRSNTPAFRSRASQSTVRPTQTPQFRSTPTPSARPSAPVFRSTPSPSRSSSPFRPSSSRH